MVKSGDILARIDSQELIFQLQQLQAQLNSIKGEEERSYREPYDSQLKQQELLVEIAEQDFNTAQNNLERMQVLYDAGAISEKEYEDALNSVKKAKNNLEQQKEALALLYKSHKTTSGTSQYYAGLKQSLQAQIDAVKHKIDETIITAPMDGIIADLTVKEGAFASPGIPLMTVFKKDAYRIEVFVLSEDVASLNKGMKVTLVQKKDSGNVYFEGYIEKIAPSAVQKISSLGLKEQRVKVTIVPEISGNVELRPGYTLDVHFTTEKQDNKLVVPKTALFPYNKDKDALWVVRDGKAVVQPVKKGFENDREVVIEEGLQVGDYVILNPHLEELKEGKKIVGKD